ncbi:MFS transporter [Leucobacter sp. Psy1]|uniref:MFS transporter n=1 Tax=Leucobacter sp. Psy1 TaxID=2875729 RepID=UPI001CD7449E|nr:MFS transporter [Leucobacter sp. Psy1]UBH07420.1 MFS transporter [Leucobacter sp. Psy1]
MQIQSRKLDRKVTVSSVIGTIIEWYDFYVYGTASALVLGALFFSAEEPLVGTIAAFATFAVGFLARPVGAIVFGHFGDRIGRKRMLIYSLTGMGVATFLIGCLPTYDQIGVWAPVLLVAMRLIQGFCVGGEWGGAMLMAVEHAPVGRKSLAGALVQVGSPAGLVLSTLVIAIFSGLPGDAFLQWGWRVPFLLSAVLVLIGLFIRLKVEESPEFAQVKETGDEKKIPLFATLRHAPIQVLGGVALTLAPFMFFYFLATFILTFGVNNLGFESSFLLWAVVLGASLELVTMPIAGHLGDRYGQGRVFVVGAVLLAIVAFPMVHLLIANPGNKFVLLAIMVLVMSLVHPLTYALLSTMFADLFTTDVRYTGVSLAFSLGGVVGGFTPLIFTSMLTSPSYGWLIPGYMVLMSIVTTIAGVLAARTIRKRQVLTVTEGATTVAG